MESDELAFITKTLKADGHGVLLVQNISNSKHLEFLLVVENKALSLDDDLKSEYENYKRLLLFDSVSSSIEMTLNEECDKEKEGMTSTATTHFSRTNSKGNRGDGGDGNDEHNDAMNYNDAINGLRNIESESFFDSIDLVYNSYEIYYKYRCLLNSQLLSLLNLFAHERDTKAMIE
eukprot:Awhi_evm1s8873